MQIQQLSLLFVLSSDEELRLKAQDAIKAFPRELPFEYEEEKSIDAPRQLVRTPLLKSGLKLATSTITGHLPRPTEEAC